MKSKVKMIKSRRLKSIKYKKKTRVRVHLGKNIHRGGADSTFHIGITDDGKYLYITDTKENYLYKIDLEEKTYQMNKTVGGDYPLKSMTQRLRNIIANARDGNDRIASILNTTHKTLFDSLRPAKPPITPFPEAQPGKVFQKHFPTNMLPYYISPEAAAAEAAIAARAARAKAAAEAAIAARAKAAAEAAEAAEAKTEDSPRNTSPRNTNHSHLETRVIIPNRTPSPKSFLTRVRARVREGFQRFTRKITRRTPTPN